MTNITRTNPFEDFFSGFGKGYFVKPFAFPQEADVPIRIDVKEDEKSFTVKANVPGVKKEDIQVDVADDEVTLRAETKSEKEGKKDEKIVFSERSYGMASRSFTLPAAVDAKAASAEYKDGVLTLVLPKKANGSAKRVAVT